MAEYVLGFLLFLAMITFIVIMERDLEMPYFEALKRRKRLYDLWDHVKAIKKPQVHLWLVLIFVIMAMLLTRIK